MCRRSVCSVGLAALIFGWLAVPSPTPASPRHEAGSMLEPHAAPVLVDHFETFLRDKDIEAFQRGVMARYTEATLARLARSGSPQSRRAAILALGLTGTFQVNDVVARSLRDPDPVVRNLAQNALWAIWFRADTDENNATLLRVRDLTGREQTREAIELSTRLIARSPGFAEAYNQRAIALFAEERFAESAEDCRRVLQRNPNHIGALSGMGQCYIRLGRRADALATFRRALELQPFSAGLRETIQALEAEVD